MTDAFALLPLTALRLVITTELTHEVPPLLVQGDR